MRVRPVAGVVVRDDEGRVLLVRRADGTWGVPGGGLEPGESWAAAAVRECLEETGWLVRLDDLLGIYSDPSTQTDSNPDGDLRHFVGVVFIGTPIEQSGSPDGEALEVRWADPETLPAPLFPPDAPVLRDALNPRLRRPVIG